jgi:DNA-binding NarL/FixJ family response regulator
MPITVIVADDHQLMREGLCELLSRASDLKVLAEAENGRAAVRRALQRKPDVVIMGVAMPDPKGIEATLEIVKRCPDTKVIALSMHGDRYFASRMFRAGASVCLLKDCAFNDLLCAIHDVTTGRTRTGPAMGGDLVKGQAQPRNPSRVPLVLLTPREREVLQLLAEGHNVKTIGRRLHISTKTVETHRQHIMTKLNKYSLAELTKYALREGLTRLED